MTIAIDLSEEQKRSAEEQAKRLGYKNLSEYFAALVDKMHRLQTRDELEQSLVDAMDEPVTPLTDADFDEVFDEAMAEVAKRQKR